MRDLLAGIRASSRPSAAAAPIPDRLLLDRHGRPLRGAARAARIRRLERDRVPPPASPSAPAFALRALRLARVRAPALSIRAVRLVAITTVMTFVFATVIGIGGFVAQRGTVAFGASTTLTVIGGDVAVRATEDEPFSPAADGALLRAAMTVRTGADGYAVLTYFEGSTVSLEPNTTLVIAALRADPDGSTAISMRQVVGKTWHAVTNLVHPGSRYDVRTPTAVATVRGTRFEVDVGPDARGEVASTIATTEGTVGTAKVPTPTEPRPPEVLVRPGFQVTVTATAPLPQPVPQPEPERVVSVSVDAPEGLVIDPVGRANGIKDGTVVVQTPGATVETVDGKVVVRFTKISEGKLATVVDPGRGSRGPVKVVTTVRDRGGAERRAEAETQPVRQEGALASAAPTDRPVSPTPGPPEPPAPAVVEIDVTAAGVTVAPVGGEEGREIADGVKVADAPALREEGRAFVPAVGLPSLPAAGPASPKAPSEPPQARRSEGSGGRGFVPAVSLPPIPTSVAGRPAPPVAAHETASPEDEDRSPSAQGPGAPSPTGPASPQPGRPTERPQSTSAPVTPPPATPAPVGSRAPARTADATSEPRRQTPVPTETPAPVPGKGSSTSGNGLVPKLVLPTLPTGGQPPAGGNGRP